MKRRIYFLLLSAAFALGLILTMAAPADAAGNVIPPKANPVGSSYGEWSAHWWQWLYQTPVNINPEFSPPGSPSSPAPVDCSSGQSGHVWFIGGTFQPTSSNPTVSRADVYRTCNVPTGTFLFFPILN